MLVLFVVVVVLAEMVNGGTRGGYRHSSGNSHKESTFSRNYILTMLTFLKTKRGPHPVVLYIRDKQPIACLLALYILRAQNVFLVFCFVLFTYLMITL